MSRRRYHESIENTRQSLAEVLYFFLVLGYCVLFCICVAAAAC